MNSNNNMRGGKRPGAGRPPFSNERRKSMTCRVAVKTYDRIKGVADETGESVGKTVDFIVDEYFKISEK